MACSFSHKARRKQIHLFSPSIAFVVWRFLRNYSHIIIVAVIFNSVSEIRVFIYLYWSGIYLCASPRIYSLRSLLSKSYPKQNASAGMNIIHHLRHCHKKLLFGNSGKRTSYWEKKLLRMFVLANHINQICGIIAVIPCDKTHQPFSISVLQMYSLLTKTKVI